MASSVTNKQSCVKCDKGRGIATCGGCQQWFCAKHFNEHRQELANEMDYLGEEHDLIQRDLSQNNDTHDLLNSISNWEQESIKKIQAAAEQARIDIQKYLDYNKKQMQISLSQLTDELKSSREADDYTEADLKKWLQRMKEIREILDKPSSIYIIHDDDLQSVIHLIQVKQIETIDKTTKSSEDTASITSSEHGMYCPKSSQISSAVDTIEDFKKDTLQTDHICQKCGRKFSMNNNLGGDCVHSGTWHAKYEDCSYVKCGFYLGIKASIGKQHWSCCYSLEPESNMCSESKPHIAVPREN